MCCCDLLFAVSLLCGRARSSSLSDEQPFCLLMPADAVSVKIVVSPLARIHASAVT